MNESSSLPSLNLPHSLSPSHYSLFYRPKLFVTLAGWGGGALIANLLQLLLIEYSPWLLFISVMPLSLGLRTVLPQKSWESPL